jgi:hypothetical protein
MDSFELRRADVALFCGIIMSIFAAGGTFAGKLPGRFGEVASRTKNPGQYWSGLVIYYLGAIALIGYHLHRVHASSN